MFLNRLLFGLVLTCLFALSAHAESLEVSLLLGDTYTRTTLDAVKTLKKEHPELEHVVFHTYPSRDIRSRDLSALKASKLVIILIMGRELSDALAPELAEVIKKGGKVYAVGGAYDSDHREMGIRLDERISEYYGAGGAGNIKNMILYALKKDFAFSVPAAPPVKPPESGIYEHTTGAVFENFDDYAKACPSCRPDRPWVGIVFYRNTIEPGRSPYLDALIKRLEDEGLNVLPVFGFPPEAPVERFFFNGKGESRVSAVVAVGMKVGVKPAALIPLLSRLNVPVINAIVLYRMSREEWERSPVGLDIIERTWQIAQPEMAGIIQPTVIATKETMRDPGTGVEYVEEMPLPGRIERLVLRIRAWVALQEKPNREKRIALIYYNYPPGKQNIGASYLNVLPESLWEIRKRLLAEGYDAGREDLDKQTLFNDIFIYARNLGNWAQGELDRLARSGRAVLLPVDTYTQWFGRLPEGLRKEILKSWGPPEKSSVMVWQDERGRKFFVLPALRYGNVLFTPQPSRGVEQDVKKAYHDTKTPPHHQYVAFYLWLKNEFGADAVAHIGTHGTHEWLSGKEVGFGDDDPAEALIQDMPNIYPYIVDNVGEGLQAKRRGMSVNISHMTPPFDRAGLNRELRELANLIVDYTVAKEKSPSVAEAKRAEINHAAKKMGLLKDLGLTAISDDEAMEEVEHYLKEIAEKQTPFGLHTFGKSPDEHARKSTVEAMLALEKGLTGEERERRRTDLGKRIAESGEKELDAFINALAGRYVPAGQGNDPLRNPDSLPTGKNPYAFDPTKIPTPGIYAMGAKLAKELTEGYRKRHGVYPDKLTMNLFAIETIRHEGVMESQIMHLMGIRPRWDERGRVIGVEALPRSDLGRQRIDVTILPTGLYRDLFPNLMVLLDNAVSLAREQKEDDNAIRANVSRTKELLLKKGIEEERAERLASVRIFTEEPGSYGTGIDTVITMSNTWSKERQVSDVYFRRMGHPFGQGFWGERVTANSPAGDREEVNDMLFKRALSGSRMAVHSSSGNLFATLDNDDYFQYLGGSAMAIRALDGKTPEVYITDISNPALPKQEALDKAMGREMRTRYLNPEWIKGMMKEGYAGAKFMHQVIEHLWGWQVTVPEAVDAAKWNEMYETYVLDKNGLDIKRLFGEAKNRWAYQSMVARMLESVRKGYWKPDREVVETLSKEYAETAKAVGLACCDHTCNNPLLTRFTASVLLSVPGLRNHAQDLLKALDRVKNPARNTAMSSGRAAGGASVQKSVAGRMLRAPQSAPGGQGKEKGKDGKVEGYEMQEVGTAGASSAPIPYLFIAGFLGVVLLLALGWRRRRGA
ncbi:MAG: cobaltochelatase subunit CobN [Thermodesulfovibrionales bacterium]